ncbi:VOC family protein [Candidatus Bealeia paramacronuclearis]|uniref:VOC family protein n=1 Tax=Candidatus Bealeia paramacronuclearis TaxID=1921001 RepID=A0ABZ2C3J7_9PROT|nr:VOC family protein [Candidatus Bealeia paramacronuclearis]
MTHPTFIMFYVENPTLSAQFYSQILEATPVESSPMFALFMLDSGVKLGLWAKSDVQPQGDFGGSGFELGFAKATIPELQSTYQNWKAQGVKIIQDPTDMDFGHTFTAEDPDGHRLRVFVLNMQ